MIIYPHQFLNNKYTKLYYLIILNAISQERFKNKYVYYESHHIIPKSLGGSNDKNNLVLLTAREHYICHALLVKMTDGDNRRRMFFALRQMSNCNKTNRRYTSKLYANLKGNMKHSNESIQRMKKKRGPQKNPRLNTSASHRQNLSKSLMNHSISNETKLKISNSKLGVSLKTIRSPEHNEKIRLSNQGLLYWNNGAINKRSKEGPGEDWIRGMLPVTISPQTKSNVPHQGWVH